MDGGSDIIANVARGWSREPAGVALGTDRTALSAALWTSEADEVQEVWAEPDLERHILCLQLSTFQADMFLDGRQAFSHRFAPGQVNLVRAGQRPRAVTTGPVKVLHIYVPTALINDLASQADLADVSRDLVDPHCTYDRVFDHLGREMIAEMRHEQPLSRLRVDALGQDIAIHLLRQHSSLVGRRCVERQLDRGRLAPWQLKRVNDFLSAHLDEDISLAEVAAAVRLSPFHFARAFKRSTGVPPQRALMERRVERAREMLAGTNMGLAEIALACGFAGQSHFTTAFKRYVGMSPGRWREMTVN